MLWSSQLYPLVFRFVVNRDNDFKMQNRGSFRAINSAVPLVVRGVPSVLFLLTFFDYSLLSLLEEFSSFFLFD